MVLHSDEQIPLRLMAIKHNILSDDAIYVDIYL